MNTTTLTPTLGRVGLWSPELRTSAHAPAAAAELDEARWGALWIPGGSGTNSIWDDADSLLTHAPTTTVAFGVLSIWSADADIAAAAHNRLVSKHGNRLLAGFGVSTSAAADARGRIYTTPLRAMNGFLDLQDQDPEGITPQHRLVGALGPKMTQLGGHRAAGVHSFLSTAQGVASTRELLGPGPIIAPYLPVVIESNAAAARTIIRRYVAMFIGFPTYQANLRRLGFTDDDVVPGGSDRLIDAISAWGSLETIHGRIRDYLDAGATHVPLHVLGADRGLPVDSWRRAAPLAGAFS